MLKNSILLVFFLLFVFACDSGVGEQQYYQPPVQKNDGWEISTLNQEGMDEQIINALLEKIINNSYKNIHSLVIVRNNKLVLDNHFKTRLTYVDEYVGNTNLELHAMMSVTKSMVSLLTGIAINNGFLEGIYQKVYPFFNKYKPFKNWSNSKSKVTIKDFLTMRHGFVWDEISYPYSDSRNSYYQMFLTHDWVRFFLDLETVGNPGEVFSYSSGVSHTMGKLISNVSQMKLEEFADFYLLNPLGISERKWIKAPNGMADDIYLTTRSMAKIGQLVLNRGRWKNQRIVSEAWIDESVKNRVDVDETFGYAYFWWKYSFQVSNYEIESTIAWGHGGQFIFVFKTLNLVICFTSGNYDNDLEIQPFDMVREYILPSVH